MIEEGVANIVRLLSNSEVRRPHRGPGGDEDAFEAKNRKNGQWKRWQHDGGKLLQSKQQRKPKQQYLDRLVGGLSQDDLAAVSSFVGGNQRQQQQGEHLRQTLPRTGKLTGQLMAQGLLTKKMVTTLYKEWEQREEAQDSRGGRYDPPERS